MRSREEKLQRLVCAEHCRFFKPWREEDRRCGGHRWLLEKAKAAEGILDPLERLRGCRPVLPLRADALLLRTVCSRCAFYPEDCRYRSAASAREGIPCGGIVVMDLLLERGHLSAAELHDPPWLRGHHAEECC